MTQEPVGTFSWDKNDWAGLSEMAEGFDEYRPPLSSALKGQRLELACQARTSRKYSSREPPPSMLPKSKVGCDASRSGPDLGDAPACVDVPELDPRAVCGAVDGGMLLGSAGRWCRGLRFRRRGGTGGRS
jgi:hypothetical protein